MTKTQEKINNLTSKPEIVNSLIESFDFELSNTFKKSDWFKIKEGFNHYVIAHDGAGGEYAIVEMQNKELLLHVTSEGQAGIIGQSFTDFLIILLSSPYWKDLLKFSGGGKLDEMKKAVPFLIEEYKEDYPNIEKDILSIKKHLNIDTSDSSVESLFNTVTEFQEIITIINEDGETYDSLFNTFVINDNPQWKKKTL